MFLYKLAADVIHTSTILLTGCVTESSWFQLQLVGTWLPGQQPASIQLHPSLHGCCNTCNNLVGEDAARSPRKSRISSNKLQSSVRHRQGSHHWHHWQPCSVMCIQTCYVADSEVQARHHHAIHSSSIAYTVAASLPAWKHHWVKQQHDVSMRSPQFANNAQ